MKRNSLSGAREACRAAFFDGANCAYFASFEGERDEDGYPKGFHTWPRDQRDAWLAGFDVGLHDRIRKERLDG